MKITGGSVGMADFVRREILDHKVPTRMRLLMRIVR